MFWHVEKCGVQSIWYVVIKRAARCHKIAARKGVFTIELICRVIAYGFFFGWSLKALTTPTLSWCCEKQRQSVKCLRSIKTHCKNFWIQAVKRSDYCFFFLIFQIKGCFLWWSRMICNHVSFLLEHETHTHTHIYCCQCRGDAPNPCFLKEPANWIDMMVAPWLSLTWFWLSQPPWRFRFFSTGFREILDIYFGVA